MNIEKWDVEDIMQLPDHCFGRRWVVSVTTKGVQSETDWDISEIAFPNIGVIWNFLLYPAYISSSSSHVRIAIGEQKPTSTAMMDKLEPLIVGLGRQGPEPRDIRMSQNAGSIMIPMRTVKRFQGKKLIMEAVPVADGYQHCICIVTVSSIPKEVPDWVVSGLAGVRS